MYTDRAGKDLGGDDGGLYYPLNAALLPEAFQDFYKGTLAEKGGCKGLQVRPSFARDKLSICNPSFMFMLHVTVHACIA